MKGFLSVAFCLAVVFDSSAQGDKNLLAPATEDLRLIIGIVIAVLVIIAMYFLLRKEGK